jgi:hypothetical protein
MSKPRIKPILRIVQRDYKELKLYNNRQVGTLVWNLLDHLQLKYGWDMVHEMAEEWDITEMETLCDDFHYVMNFEETE